MQKAIALAAVFAASDAADLKAEAQVNASLPDSQYYVHDQSYPEGYNYYAHPGYHTPDYSHQYGETLPGADFNKQVWEFDEDHSIFDQNDYEERVKVEAELMVSLEALKAATAAISYDITQLQAHIAL